MFGWLLLIAGGGFAAYKYASHLDSTHDSSSPNFTTSKGIVTGERVPRPKFSGKYRERLLQALDWYDSDRGPDAPTTFEHREWIEQHDHVIEIAKRHKRPVLDVASALAKDGGSGHYLYRAFPDDKIPRK